MVLTTTRAEAVITSTRMMNEMSLTRFSGQFV